MVKTITFEDRDHKYIQDLCPKSKTMGKFIVQALKEVYG